MSFINKFLFKPAELQTNTWTFKTLNYISHWVWMLLVYLSFGGELTVKLPFRTKHVNTINISDFLIFLLSLCFRFLLFFFSIRRGPNKGEQCQWNQTAELIYDLNHPRQGAVTDVTGLQKLIWSETFGSEPLQCQQRKAPVLHPTAAPHSCLCPACQAPLSWDWAELSIVFSWRLPCSTLMGEFHLTAGGTSPHLHQVSLHL